VTATLIGHGQCNGHCRDASQDPPNQTFVRFLCGKFFSQQSQNGLRIGSHSVNQRAGLEALATRARSTVEHITGCPSRSSQAT
jgi:hypothetical protein